MRQKTKLLHELLCTELLKSVTIRLCIASAQNKNNKVF